MANSTTCSNEKDFNLDFNSNPIVAGEFWVAMDNPLDLENTKRICVETTSNIDAFGSGLLATTEYPSCYECAVNNNGVIIFQSCFGGQLPLVVNVSGLTEMEYNQFVNDFNSGFTGSYYIEYIDNSILKKNCFILAKEFPEDPITTLSTAQYTQISNFLQGQGSQIVNEINYSATTSCEDCFKNVAVIYQVTNCVTDSTDYVYLPQGFPENYLISYTDGINEFCGVVRGQTDLTTTTFTYVTNFGPFNAEQGCDKCLQNQNKKVRIENCSDDTVFEVVWASQLFGLGDATNFELRGLTNQCFRIIGNTTDPVTTSGFLDYEPHSGCTSCQECNGVNYEYFECLDFPNTFVGVFQTNQILNYGDTFFNPIDGVVYSVGNQTTNIADFSLPSVLQLPCESTPDYQVWEARECLTQNVYYVLTDNVVTTNDIVKLLYGENDYLCVELINPTNQNQKVVFNSKRDGLGNTITYTDCTECTDGTTFGVRTVDCDNQDLTVFDLNYTAYTNFFNIGPVSDIALEAREPIGPIRRNPFAFNCFVDGNGDCRTVIELCPQTPVGNPITPSSTYFSCPDCRTFNPPDTNTSDCINGTLRAVNYNGLPLIVGDVCSVDIGLQYNICATITDVDITGSTNLAITEYTDCYDCLRSNQAVVEVTNCFGPRIERYTVTVDGLGFLPEFGSGVYMTIENSKGDVITSCFTFGSIRQLTTGLYNEGLLEGSLFTPQPTPIQEQDCNTCVQNNLFTYEVTRCTDGGIIDYVNLPFGLIGDLISYTDGINQYCGTVNRIGGTIGTFTYISNFGNSTKCDACLEVANEKILIQNCTDSNIQEVVWASALFQNGDVSNLSTQDGCFEVIGLTQDETTINTFFNFDPQPGCEPCIECNGINYAYQTCNSFANFGDGTLNLIQTPGQNISCSEYSYGSGYIYLGFGQNIDTVVFDPLTNSIVTTIPGSGSGYYNETTDIEYYDTGRLYSLTNSCSYFSSCTGYINKIDSIANSGDTIFTESNTRNIHLTTDSTNNRIFYTSVNTSSGTYFVNSFNTSTNTVTSQFSSLSGYYRIKYAPNVNKVYTLSGYYNVKVLNADDLTPVATLTFSDYLSDIEYNPCTEQIYITTSGYNFGGDGQINVIDTVSDTVINTVSTYNRSQLIKYNPTDSKMYITNSGYYFPGNTTITVFNPQTNGLLGTYSTYPNIYNTQDFTFYPTDNELYLTQYSFTNGSNDYLLELPIQTNSIYGTFKSYQYIPNGDIFYNPAIGDCCEVIGTSSSYYQTLYSVQTYNDCPSCNTCHGQIWVATGCGLSESITFNVTVNNSAQVGDIVRIMWGSNGWICVVLQSLYTPPNVTSFDRPNPIFYNSERDGSGNTIIYNDCTSCENSTAIGITLVNCDTLVERYVSITTENYMNLNSLEGIANFVINDSSGCYIVSNFCPIPLSETTTFTPVEFFPTCAFCSRVPEQPRSANTESTVCEICCECGATGSTTNIITPPHPVWTDGYGTAVTQLNMIVIGGNGLNA